MRRRRLALRGTDQRWDSDGRARGTAALMFVFESERGWREGKGVGWLRGVRLRERCDIFGIKACGSLLIRSLHLGVCASGPA
eukprot:6211255-Pleurochrysis_carterae.AAC.1